MAIGACESKAGNADEAICMYQEQKPFSNAIRVEWNTIVVTVFLLIMSQSNFRLVYNQKENPHYNRIPFNVLPMLSMLSTP